MAHISQEFRLCTAGVFCSFFGFFAFMDTDMGSIHPQWLSIRAMICNPSMCPDPDPLSGFVEHPVFCDQRLFFSIDHILQFLGDVFNIIRVDHISPLIKIKSWIIIGGITCDLFPAIKSFQCYFTGFQIKVPYTCTCCFKCHIQCSGSFL